MKKSLENKVQIINYLKEFKEKFKSINYEWIEKYFEVTELDKKSFDNPKNEILDKKGFIYLAKYNNDIVGSVALERISDRQYALTKMGVESGYQGKKIGQLLIKTAIEKCIELELESVVLYTNHVLISALNLYFKNGFKMVQLDYVPYKRGTIKMELKFDK